MNARPILIAPSILSADHARLGEEIRAVESAGADWLHVDVMDGHFVPNLTLGPPVIAALRKVTRVPFDVHLMIERPEQSVEQYVEAGANHITVHVEACVHLHRMLSHLRNLNVKAGVSLNPSTPLCSIKHVLHMVDMVLVMSVNPGFGGQAFIPEVLPKISELREMQQTRHLTFDIALDGGIGVDTIGAATTAGANVFIAGSAIFKTSDYAGVITKLRHAARAG